MVQNRQTSTKQHIREALIQLLLEEKFETISVSKLCQRASIVELFTFTILINST